MVFIEDWDPVSLDKETIRRNRLVVGMSLPVFEFDQIYQTDSTSRAVDIGIGFIAYRMRSEFEVRRRLRKAAFEPGIIDRTIDRLAEMNLINDDAFAVAFARDAMLGCRRGPLRVRHDLQRLGVARETALKAIDEITEQTDLMKTATALAQSRWRQTRHIADLKKRTRRIYDFLVRRGFSFNVARDAVAGLKERDNNNE